MTAFLLFTVAAWFWFCLAMCDNNHGRIAVLGPVLIPLGLIAVFAKWAANQMLRFNRWVGGLGNDKGEE